MITKRLIITQSAMAEFWEKILLALPCGTFPPDPTAEKVAINVLKHSQRVGSIKDSPNIAIYEAPQLGVRAHIDERDPAFDLVLCFALIPRCTERRARPVFRTSATQE